MTASEEQAYCEKYNVRRIERCCGNCKYFDRQYESVGCKNQKQADFDSYEQLCRRNGEEPNQYGAYAFGVDIDEGFVCDLWQKGGAK